MEKEYKVPSKKQPVFFVVRKIMALTIWRGIKVIILPQTLPDKCILVANHSKKSGPMACEIGLPVFTIKWGAHEMLGNYNSRRRYLKYVFYMKKQKYSKFRATIKAAFEAVFSKLIYKGIKLIGTYPDARLKSTLKKSVKVLNDNKAILIFPEDSNNGYFDEMTHFFPGFVILSEYYYKMYNEDLPIFPIYYKREQKKMVVGTPIYVQKLIQQGLDREEIAQYYRDAVNNLYYQYFK